MLAWSGPRLANARTDAISQPAAHECNWDGLPSIMGGKAVGENELVSEFQRVASRLTPSSDLSEAVSNESPRSDGMDGRTKAPTLPMAAAMP